MSAPFPKCPHLPESRPGLDWRTLHVFREDERGPEFYYACLEYGHSLWLSGLAARAMLCLDLAMGADLHGAEPVLQTWPMPYAAMVWFMNHTPPDVFIGNPRVHFQHYADRLREPRREQRRWRSWACWALAKKTKPQLPGDPKHNVIEPTIAQIAANLDQYGLTGENKLWQSVLTEIQPIK